jgi:uncharacterized small protein (DUF1192 family)
MSNEFFNKITEGTKQATAKMSVAAKIAKLKVEIATQNAEKDRHVKSIGGKTYAIFAKNKQLDGKLLQEEISSELSLIERIERHIEDLEDEIARLQGEFRSPDTRDIVDASDVREADD